MNPAFSTGSADQSIYNNLTITSAVIGIAAQGNAWVNDATITQPATSESLTQGTEGIHSPSQTAALRMTAAGRGTRSTETPAILKTLLLTHRTTR